MKTSEIKAALSAVKHPDEAAPEELLALCRAEYGSRPHRRRAGRWELVRSQLRFIALPVWALQGALLQVGERVQPATCDKLTNVLLCTLG